MMVSFAHSKSVRVYGMCVCVLCVWISFCTQWLLICRWHSSQRWTDFNRRKDATYFYRKYDKWWNRLHVKLMCCCCWCHLLVLLLSSVRCFIFLIFFSIWNYVPCYKPNTVPKRNWCDSTKQQLIHTVQSMQTYSIECIFQNVSHISYERKSCKRYACSVNGSPFLYHIASYTRVSAI